MNSHQRCNIRSFFCLINNSEVVQESNKCVSQCVCVYQHIFLWHTQHNTKQDIAVKLNEFHFKCLVPSLFTLARCVHISILYAFSLSHYSIRCARKACKQYISGTIEFDFPLETWNEIKYASFVRTNSIEWNRNSSVKLLFCICIDFAIKFLT